MVRADISELRIRNTCAASNASFSPPALRERRHRGLARRLVVVRWCGRYAAGGGGGGFGGLGGGGFGGFGGSMEAIDPRL